MRKQGRDNVVCRYARMLMNQMCPPAFDSAGSIVELWALHQPDCSVVGHARLLTCNRIRFSLSLSLSLSLSIYIYICIRPLARDFLHVIFERNSTDWPSRRDITLERPSGLGMSI